MSSHLHLVSRFLRLRKLTKPAVVAGAGDTSHAICFEEFIAFAGEFIGVIFLPVLARRWFCVLQNRRRLWWAYTESRPL